MMEQEGSRISCFRWRYINGGGYGGFGTPPHPPLAFVIRGMWAELVMPHWADHRLLLMAMNSVNLHAVWEPGLLAPGGVFWSLRELKCPGWSWLCCWIVVHTHCRITSEPGLVNRSHVDSHVDQFFWLGTWKCCCCHFTFIKKWRSAHQPVLRFKSHRLNSHFPYVGFLTLSFSSQRNCWLSNVNMCVFIPVNLCILELVSCSRFGLPPHSKWETTFLFKRRVQMSFKLTLFSLIIKKWIDREWME